MHSLLVAVAFAGPPPPEEPLVVEVREAVSLPAGCTRLLDARAIPGYPVRRTDDLVLDLPGLWHGSSRGAGGARDRAWRGWSASPGADLELTVDGVPIGLQGHVGGDGWTDVGWIPRVLVDRIDACRGLSDGGVGPGAMAGSLAYGLGLQDEGWLASLGAATDGSGTLTVAFRPEGWSRRTFLVLDAEDANGVGVDHGWHDIRVAAGIERRVRQLDLTASLVFHGSGWDTPPLLRASEVISGEERLRGGPRFWSGSSGSQRAQLQVGLGRAWSWGGLTLDGWFAAVGQQRSANLSGLLVDPVQGDGFQLGGTTFDSGLRARFARSWNLFNDVTRFEGGLEVRGTSAESRLQALDLSGDPLGLPSSTRRGWMDLGAWVQAHVGVARRFQLDASLRLDRHDRTLWREIEPDVLLAGAAPSFSPRIALSGQPSRVAGLWLSWSRGARPPSADDLPTVALTPLVAPQVDTVEGGLSLALRRLFEARASIFVAVGHDEQVRDLLTDDVILRSNTRRIGGELTLVLRPIQGVRIQADGGFVDARASGGTLLPYTAPGRVAVGLYADERRLGPLLLTGGLRFAWTAARPLTDDTFAGDVATLDLRARVGWRAWRFDVFLDNLAPWDWPTAEVIRRSRWDPDAPATSEPARHWIAGSPFALGLGVTWLR